MVSPKWRVTLSLSPLTALACIVTSRQMATRAISDSRGASGLGWSTRVAWKEAAGNDVADKDELYSNGLASRGG